MHGWQANIQRTCAQPVLLGLCPKLKYPPFYGGIFIILLRLNVEELRLVVVYYRNAILACNYEMVDKRYIH